MQHAKVYHIRTRLIGCMASHVLLTCLIACAAFTNAAAQDCPHNIDFETGTFDGWTCYTGFVAGTNGQNIISLSATGPESNRHTMYTANSGGQTDPYGDFPVNCPNGSGHSIRLGNDQGGGQAEGISYEFVIPANKDVYSLIYHYAVVFQDPDHLEFQQPRMEIEITNVTDNIRIDCSSFTFHPYGSVLPGFELSANPGSSTAVWYKNWSAVSINLDGQAGKTIRLFFKTADCTFRRHFGYAYIDVNSECSGEFVGATYCHDDTAINVVAPYGYQTYTWYDKDFTTVLGSTQTLTLRPPPLAGTTIAVTLVPYDGYGCLDTLYARLVDTLTLTANAGADMLSCNLTPVQIGAPPKPGLIYNWSPGTFLSSPTIANPVVKPDITTTYIITTNNSGGGCRTTDTVLVKASVIDNTMRLTGKAAYCVDSEDSAVLSVRPTSSIQWFKDDIPINGANQPTYKVLEPGNYSALLVDVVGCSMTTSKQPVVIEIPRPGITYPVKYAVVNLPLTLQARSFGKTVQWQPANYLDKSTVFTPVFKGPSEQFYTIGITSAAGCLTVDSQLVKTINGVGIYVPTGFTPNNDKKNDFLRPLLYGVKEVHYFKVFNRLGQLLYQSKDDFPGWNGMFNGVQQTSQAVVWVLEVVGVDGIVYLKKGTSVLVR